MLYESRSSKPESTNEDFHFFPQNWRCNFATLFPHYTLIKYATGKPMLRQFSSFFTKVNVSETSRRFLLDQLSHQSTVHVTSGSEARKFFEHRLRSSPFLIEFIVRMFYWDFRIFDYTIPKFSFDSI